MAGDEKLDWIYKNANSFVNREDYLLGRKVDKALEQLNEDEKQKRIILPTPKNHVEHECIPPSIRDFNKIVHAEQVDLSAKLQEDPLVTIRKREEEARRQFLQNPVQLKKLQDALKHQEKYKKKSKSKKGLSDGELDEKIKQKIKLLRNSELDKKSKNIKKSALDTILMHKFNALKNKLSESDLNDILNGKTDSSSDESLKNRKQNHKPKDSSSSETDSENEKYLKYNEKRHKSLNKRRITETDHYGIKYEHSEDKIKGKSDKHQSRIQPKDRYTNRHKRSGKPSSDTESYSSDKGKYYLSKSKKSHKKKRYSTSSSDCSQDESSKRYKKSNKNTSEKDLDEKIMEKLRILRQTTETFINKPYEIQNQQEIAKKNANMYKKEDKEPNMSSSKDEHFKRVMLPEKPIHLSGTFNASNSSSSDETIRKNSDSEDEKLKKRLFGLVTAEGKKITLTRTNKTAYPNKNKKVQISVKAERKVIKKLSEEKKDKLRKEMMRNAEVRDKEREENLRKYRENQKHEETNVMKYDTSVIHNQFMKTAKHSSIADRIKSNLNNIQRSSRHMDTNFSKR